MRLLSLACRNIKGFEGSFEFECGDVNVISGKNGDNKTSTLSLVIGLFGKGNPRMLRTGATDGEIRAVISDEAGETWELTRNFEPGKVETPKVKSSSAGTLGAPATFLKSLIDPISIDPIGQAMNASEEKQCEVLLEVLKLDLDHAALVSACDGAEFPGLSSSLAKAKKLQALDAISLVAEQIYERRKDINRNAKSKRSLSEELKGAVGEPDQVDWSSEALQITRQIEDSDAKEAAGKLEAERGLSSVRAEIVKDASEKVSAIGLEYSEKIANLERERDQKQNEIKEEEKQKLAKLQEAHTKLVSEIIDAARPIREDLSVKRAEALNKAAARQQADRSREIAASAEEQADSLEQESMRLTGALLKLDKLKSDLLKDLPIPGAKVESGVAYLDGVPLSEVNTEKRQEFWIQVAALRASELGIVCYDGAEAMDPENFASFVKRAKRTGLQWFIARVDAGPMRIEKI